MLGGSDALARHKLGDSVNQEKWITMWDCPPNLG
jgi:hypothetical protein